VDPRVKAEHNGLFQEKGEDGSRYLRRMKEQSLEANQPESAPATGTGSPVSSGPPGGKERRRSPRFRCSGSAEFRAEGSDIRMWGTLSDVSLHGCYIEMNNTFPVDTRVSLALEAMGVRVQVQAVVRVSYPFLGMGMCFTEVEFGQQSQLEQLLAAVAGANARPDPSLMAQPDSSPSIESADAKALLDEIARFFSKNSLLSRKEFYELAKQNRRASEESS
jgi:hypothetical protein